MDISVSLALYKCMISEPLREDRELISKCFVNTIDIQALRHQYADRLPSLFISLYKSLANHPIASYGLTNKEDTQELSDRKTIHLVAFQTAYNDLRGR